MNLSTCFRARKQFVAIVFAVIILCGLLPAKSNAFIVGTSPSQPLIFIFNDPSWTLFSQDTLTMSGFTVTGATGLSFNPVDGSYYAIVKVIGGPRRLATVDPETGVCTDIGSMGANFSTITFTPSGKLYAMAGQGAGITWAQNLYSVNITTGVPTFLAGPFPLQADGEVLAFNPGDGFIYHWSGNGTALMEKIDTGTFVATPVVQSGAAHNEVFGAVYKGGGEFYVTDILSRALTISAAGFVTEVATGLPDDIRGLGYGDPVLPVELSSFTSNISGRNVTLNWSTSSEVNNSGFEIQRSSESGVWAKVAFVKGNQTTSHSQSYEFVDRGLSSGKYNYRLKQMDFNGQYEYFTLSNEVIIGVPGRFDLSQNYPNPFNPSTKINFDVPVDSRVTINLFDISGKQVASLLNEVKTAGYYTVDFNASGLPSGVYFYRATAVSNNGSFTSVKKMTLIK